MTDYTRDTNTQRGPFYLFLIGKVKTFLCVIFFLKDPLVCPNIWYEFVWKFIYSELNSKKNRFQVSFISSDFENLIKVCDFELYYRNSKMKKDEIIQWYGMLKRFKKVVSQCNRLSILLRSRATSEEGVDSCTDRSLNRSSYIQWSWYTCKSPAKLYQSIDIGELSVVLYSVISLTSLIDF